jgi:hypothetical protein
MTMNHSPTTSDRGTPAVTFGDAFPMGFTYDALPMRVRFGPSGVSQFRSFAVSQFRGKGCGCGPRGLVFPCPACSARVDAPLFTDMSAWAPAAEAGYSMITGCYLKITR